MKKKISRVASFMLAVMMLISLLPAGALASEMGDTVTLTGTISFPEDAYLDGGDLTIDIWAMGEKTDGDFKQRIVTSDIKDIPFAFEFDQTETAASIRIQLSNTYDVKTNLYTSNYGAGNYVLTSDGLVMDESPYDHFLSFEEVAAADMIIPAGKELSGKITGDNLQVLDGEFVGIIFGDFFTRAYIDAESHEYKTVLPYGIAAGEYTPYLDKSVESVASNILTGQYYAEAITVDPALDLEGVNFAVDTGCTLSGKVILPGNAVLPDCYEVNPRLRFKDRTYYINTSFTGIRDNGKNMFIPYMIGVAKEDLPASGIIQLSFEAWRDDMLSGAYSNLENGEYYYSAASSNGTVRDEALATEITITENMEEINFHINVGALYIMNMTMDEDLSGYWVYFNFFALSENGEVIFETSERYNSENTSNLMSFVLPGEYIGENVYLMYKVGYDTDNAYPDLYTGKAYICEDGTAVWPRNKESLHKVGENNEIAFRFAKAKDIEIPNAVESNGVKIESDHPYLSSTTKEYTYIDSDTTAESLEVTFSPLSWIYEYLDATILITDGNGNTKKYTNDEFNKEISGETITIDGSKFTVTITTPYVSSYSSDYGFAVVGVEGGSGAATPDVPQLTQTFFLVFDKETQQPVPNALISVIRTDAASTADALSLSTGETGVAQAELEEGTYTVTTVAGDYVKNVQDVKISGNAQEVPIWLERPEIDIADNTSFTVLDGDVENTPAISGANITLEDANGKQYTLKTDAYGNASLDLADGEYTVAAIADGYQARSFKIKRSETNNNFTVYLNRDEIIKVTSTVKEMTKQEIIDAGISVDENRHVYNCSAVLTFMPDVVINYIYSDDGKVLKGETVTRGNTAVTPVARDIFLIVKSSTAWLKEIFEVQLVCDNTSAVETIESLTANMTIPDGLSLAIMAEGEQSENVVLGDVAPKGNATHKWYICGDAKGEYKLSGALNGTRVGGGISEDINLGFSIEEPITVLAGSAMELTIEAETHAVAGQPYRMRYSLENVSDKTLYDLSFTVFGGKFFEDYNVTAIEYAREYGPDALTDENLDGEGFLFETEEFKPGEKVSGVFTIEFGEGLDLSEGQGWRLVDAFTVTGAGSTTEIPTEFIWHSVLPVHNWNEGEVTKAPTCTESGVMTYTCSDVNCDIKTYTEIIPATGHDMSDYVTTEPTCTGDGTKVSTCKNNCGHSVTLTIGKLGHDMGDWSTTVEPDCVNTGTKRRDCTRCDYFETETVNSLGHDWKAEKEEDKAPTCTEAGLKSIHCTRCKETKDAEAIDKLGHDMGDWVTTVEPGCESTGTKRRDCSRCDHFETEQIPATDHKWDEGKVTIPPTAEKEGERTYTCENGCGKTKTEAIPKLVPQEVSFLFPEMTITYGDEKAHFNEAYNDSPDGGAISYTSSDESVAIVEADGKVTIVGAGETTITATAAATEKYIETSASYRLVVEKAALTVKPKTVEIFYGETAAFSEVEGEGFVLGEDVSVLTGDAVFATEYKEFDSVGEYPVTVSGITAKNYEITFAPGVLNVKKAEKYEIVLSMLTYRKGDEIKPEIAVTPADPSAEFKLEYNAGGEWTETAPEEIGKYKIRASLVKSDNIAVPETPAYTEAELEIKAGAMITVGEEGEIDIGMETDEEKGTVEFTADDETVQTVIDNVPSTGEVVIDATGATDGINTLVLPQNIVKALDESDKVDSFTVIADDAEITMDADVLSTAAKEMEENSTVSVKIDAVEKSELNDRQQAALDAISAEAHVIQLNLVVTNYDESGNPTSEDIHELRGKVDIKAKYDLPDNMDGKRIVVCYVSDNGTVTYKRAEYKDGFVHFTTDHFSYYAIMATECPHDWDNGEIITPATTTSEGIIRYTCLLCDDTKDEAIPKKTVTSGNGGGLAAGGDKSNSGADKLGNEDDKKEDADVSSDAPAVSAPEFADLGAHAWAADAIGALAEAGIIKGTSENTFSPAENITRADFAILLVRAFNLTSDNTANFADVSANDYFAAELAIARNTGIVGGIGGNKFAPRNAITRQDMMTIVYRALKNAKVDGIVAPEMTDEVALSKTYTDFTLVSDYAKDAVSVLSHMHFVNGKNGRIAPNEYTTRAEVAVLLQRILEYVK